MRSQRGVVVLLAMGLSTEARATGVLEGVFEYSGSSVEQSHIDAQVEGAIKDMGFYIRPIARHRLQKLTKPAGRFEFRPFKGGVRVVNEMVSRPTRQRRPPARTGPSARAPQSHPQRRVAIAAASS